MKQLAIIKNVGFGCRDTNRPILFFNTYIEEGMGALQILEVPQAMEIIKQYQVFDVKDLEGKACWVDVEDDKIIFNSVCLIK